MSRPPRSTSIASGADEPVAVDVRRLSAAERLGDALFTGLRLVDGVDLDAIRLATASTSGSGTVPSLEPFVEDGCLKREGARLRLTREGMLIAHEVMTVFV